MITTTHPAHMTDDERLDEVAALLATGIRRLLEKQKPEKIPVDNSPNQCLMVEKQPKENGDEHWRDKTGGGLAGPVGVRVEGNVEDVQ